MKLRAPRALTKDVILVTLVVWVGHVGIEVTRASALRLEDSTGDAVIRIFVALIGAGTSLLTYWLLRKRPLSPVNRFAVAAAISFLFAVMLGLINETLCLLLTDFYFRNYHVTGLGDVLAGRCLQHSAACYIFLTRVAFEVGLFVWVYFAWCALYVSATIAAELRDRDRRLALAEQAAQQAQLNALRFQLNPHFLFNTLNTMSGLIALDRKVQAEEVVLSLSSFLRASLKCEANQLIALEKEIDTQKAYLEIERARFADRLAVRFDIAPECRNALVPAFLLLPLTENVIKHAVAPSEEPVTLSMSARADRYELVIKVENSAPSGASERSVQSLGIGLANVRNRLAALYGGRATVQAAPGSSGGWVNVVRLPWREQYEENESSNRG